MEDLDVPQHHNLPSIAVMAFSICFNIINHVLIAFVAIYMTLITMSADMQPINWHAWSCTIGV